MNKERNLRSLVVLAVVISILGISTAFAALTQTLTINGQAKIAGAQWKVQFDPESLNTNLVAQASELATPSLTGTNFTYSVLLKQPGDSVTYTFDVVNEGTIDAKVDAAPQLTGIPTEYEDDITYTITYSNGAGINVNDELNVEDRKTIKVVVMFNESSDSIPEEEVTMTLNASIVYIQK